MFCQYCGNQISDDAAFCQKCGRKIRESHNTSMAQNINTSIDSQQFNRDVLIAYLYQLQTIEFSVNKLSQDLNGLDQQISRLGYSREISRPYRDGIDIPAVGAFLFLGVLLALGGSLIYSFIPLGLFSFARTVGIIIIVGTVVVALISAASKSSDNDRRQTEYQQAVQQDKTRVRKELQQRSALESKRPEYVDRLEQAKQIRDKSYQINIIPQQMRNIYAVYYLYNYLSTSQSSLESAMLHFDLNEIKSKLDTMILQQQQIILQQAQQIAQNERIIAQNEEIIDHAIATEHNIERAAQYAEVAAANSEVTAFTNTVMASIMVSRL